MNQSSETKQNKPKQLCRKECRKLNSNVNNNNSNYNNKNSNKMRKQNKNERNSIPKNFVIVVKWNNAFDWLLTDLWHERMTD